MIDPLLARAELAIEEGRLLRESRQALLREFDDNMVRLRRTIFESAMLRTELKATRNSNGLSRRF